VLSDDQGPVFVADPGTSSAMSEALFGRAIVRFGPGVGATVDEHARTNQHLAVFATDTGDVGLLPGEVETLDIGGLSWRVVVVAAYQTHPLEEVACGAVDDVLSYEMLRVDAPVPAAFVERPVDLVEASLGCG
jgi:hypothetical protein